MRFNDGLRWRRAGTSAACSSSRATKKRRSPSAVGGGARPAARLCATRVARRGGRRTPACRSPRADCGFREAAGSSRPRSPRRSSTRAASASNAGSIPKPRICPNSDRKRSSWRTGPKRVRLHPLPHLRLRRVRGQVTYVPAASVDAPRTVVLRGGMVLPAIDERLHGRRHLRPRGRGSGAARGKPCRQPRTRGRHPSRIRRSIRSRCRGASRSARSRPDRLPIVGRISNEVHGAFAYGSRGLLWSTLAAELIASELEGEPLPMEGALRDALSPARFARRAARRAGG